MAILLLLRKEYVMKKLVGKTICSVALCFLFILGNVSDVKAASKGWNLRYLKGAPQSENIFNWDSGTVHATKTTTTLSLDSISGGASVFMYTSNGIYGIASTPGASISAAAVMGLSVYASVSYYNVGSSTNYPSGTFSY